jgi:SnoaL-like domain
MGGLGVGLLLDRVEILELSARYNRAADGTDPDAIKGVFTRDGVVEMWGRGDGPAVYAGEDLTRLAAPYIGQRTHLTTDSVVVVDGDCASQRSTLLLCTRSRGKQLAALLTGRYEDDLVRTDDGWRFARRTVRIDYANEARMQLAATTV